jgi:hypothetical protein
MERNIRSFIENQFKNASFIIMNQLKMLFYEISLVLSASINNDLWHDVVWDNA